MPSRSPVSIFKIFSSICENLLELYASCCVYPPKQTDGEFEWSEAIQNYKTSKVSNHSASKKFAEGPMMSEASSGLSPFKALNSDSSFDPGKIKKPAVIDRLPLLFLHEPLVFQKSFMADTASALIRGISPVALPMMPESPPPKTTSMFAAFTIAPHLWSA